MPENKLPTPDEIIGFMHKMTPHDQFGFIRNDCIVYLDYELAKPLLTPGCTAQIWAEQFQRAHTIESVREEIVKYIPFAWDKANGCRGLSAARSMMHFIAWTFLAGDIELSERIQAMFRSYQHYGKAVLVLISEHYRVDWRQLDDGKWRNQEDDPGISADEALQLVAA